MKTEMTEFTSTEDGMFTTTWKVKLTPQEEASLWKAKYERISRKHNHLKKVVSWIFATAFMEALLITAIFWWR